MDLSRRGLLALTAATALSGCAVHYPGKPGAKSVHWWHQAYLRPKLNEFLAECATDFTAARVSISSVLDYPKTLLASLPTDQGPNVFEGTPGPPMELITTDAIVSLNPLFEPKILEDFLAVALESVRHQDQFYAVPQALDAQLICYRKSILAAANVAPPRSFADLVEAAKAVATATRSGFYAGPDGGIGTFGHVLVWAAGAELIDPLTRRAGFATKAVFDAVNSYRAAMGAFILPGNATTSWDDPAPLLKGETAMQWVGTWAMPELAEKLGDDVAVLPFPGIVDPAKRVIPVGVQSTSVKKGTANEELATNFVRWLWLEQTEKQRRFVSDFGFRIPARLSLINESPHTATGIGATVAGLVKETGRSLPPAWTTACAQIFAQAWKDALTKKDSDVEALFKKAAAEVDKELA